MARLVLTRKTGPDGMRNFGHKSQTRGVAHAQEEDVGGADRICAAPTGVPDSAWRSANAIRQAESGTPVAEICRRLGVSEASFYRWKKVYAGMGVAEIRRLKQLEDENTKLKRLVADLTLDKTMLQDALRKKW